MALNRTPAYVKGRPYHIFTIKQRHTYTLYPSIQNMVVSPPNHNRNTFAKLLPMVDLGCVQIPQYLGVLAMYSLNYTVGQKNVEILHIFGPPYSHARTRQNIVILK